MALTAITIVISVIVLNIHHRNPRSRPPRWTMVLCYRILGRVICIKQASRVGWNEGIYSKFRDRAIAKDHDESDITNADDKTAANTQKVKQAKHVEVEADYSRQWQKMARIIDKFSFCLCLSVNIFMSAILLLVVPHFA